MAIAYTFAPFWSTFEAVTLWLIAVPVFTAFIAVLFIGAWVGWTVAATPPKPTREIQTKKQKKRALKWFKNPVNKLGCPESFVQ